MLVEAMKESTHALYYFKEEDIHCILRLILFISTHLCLLYDQCAYDTNNAIDVDCKGGTVTISNNQVRQGTEVL